MTTTDPRGPQPRTDVNLSRRRNWRHLWTTDLQAGTAVHATGLVVRIGKADVSGDVSSTADNAPEILRQLTEQHGRAAAENILRRLRTEAVSVYLKRKAIAEYVPPADR